jgi:hypothetical protein
VKLNSTAPGRIELRDAIGKTFLIERAPSLHPGTTWVPLHTQTLHSTEWIYSDAATETNDVAFYRSRWLK